MNGQNPDKQRRQLYGVSPSRKERVGQLCRTENTNAKRRRPNEIGAAHTDSVFHWYECYWRRLLPIGIYSTTSQNLAMCALCMCRDSQRSSLTVYIKSATVHESNVYHIHTYATHAHTGKMHMKVGYIYVQIHICNTGVRYMQEIPTMCIRAIACLRLMLDFEHSLCAYMIEAYIYILSPLPRETLYVLYYIFLTPLPRIHTDLGIDSSRVCWPVHGYSFRSVCIPSIVQVYKPKYVITRV